MSRRWSLHASRLTAAAVSCDVCAMPKTAKRSVVVQMVAALFLLSAVPGTAAGSRQDQVEVFRDCPTCPEMVTIPAGEFVLGTDAAIAIPTEIPAELRPLRIRIARPFALGRYEVTRGEFAEFARDSGLAGRTIRCRTWVEARQGFRDLDTTWDRPNVPVSPTSRHPATCLDWHDAHDFAAWLAKRTGKPYRLPSETEWEYAAKAGTRTLRHWGNAPERGCSFANVNDRSTAARYPLSWTVVNCDDGFADVAPVGSLKPNAFGLYDMIGNVWEWIEDCASLTYVGRPTDQRAWTWDGGCKRRAQRGGGWITGPERSRSGMHSDGDDEDRADFAGMRVARDLDERLPQSALPSTVQLAAPPAPPVDAVTNTRPAARVWRDCPDCPELVYVPAGALLMGSSSDAYEHDAHSGETPPLNLTIRKPFALGRFEITRSEFAVFLRDTGRSVDGGCAAIPGAVPGAPQTCIEPALVPVFLAWLSQRSGHLFRLPSESEWEYAARGGSTGARHWSARDSHEGVSISRACDFANTYDVAARAMALPQPWARCTDHYAGLAPVGSFQPNNFGLFDTLGNARELTADCFTNSYKGRPADERPWLWADCPLRVVRGGSWLSRPRDARSAARDFIEQGAPLRKRRDLGFRVARDLTAEESIP